MTDRINAAEQERARDLLEAQTAAGQEIARALLGAGFDAELTNLANQTNTEINVTRLSEMTHTEFEQILELDTRLNQMLEDPTRLEAWTLDEFQTDTRFMAQFYSGETQASMLALANGMTEVIFTDLKDLMQSGIVAAEESAAVVNEAREAAGFTPDQADFLTAPDLQLASLVAQVEAEGGTAEVKMTRLRALMAQKVRTSFNEWLRESRQLMSTMGNDDLSAFESGLAEEALNVRQSSTQALGRAAGSVGDAAGNAFGNLAQFSFTPLSQHSFLSEVFTSRSAISEAYASLGASSGDIDHLVSRQVDTLTATLTYEQLASSFVLIPENPAEMTEEQLRALEGKMETVPKFFRNKDFASQYYDYLRESVGGDLSMADDFQEWFKTLDMHPLMKMFYQFIMMIPDEIMDYFDGAEEDKTEAEINGEDLQAIKDEIARRNGVSSEDPEDPEDPEREGNLAEQSEYQTLLAAYREVLGDTAPEISIVHNGQALELVDLSNDEVRSLTQITSLLSEAPQAAPLLNKGLELNDLLFLVEHFGDATSREDGINVAIEPDGSLAMSYEFESLMSGLTGADGINGMRDVEVAEGAAGGMAGFWLGVKMGARLPIPSPLGKIIGAIGGGVLGASVGQRWDNWDVFWDVTSLDIDEINAETLSAAIREIQDDVGALEEAINDMSLERFANAFPVINDHRDKFNLDDIEANGGIPSSLISQNGQISPAFVSMLSLDSGFWGTYTMTHEDLINFGADLDTAGITDLTGVIDDESEAFEANDRWFSSGGYLVEGGWLRDNRVENAEAFFDWLRDRNS